MRLSCWRSACSDHNNPDIEATNETRGADSTAGWPTPIIPTLPTPAAFEPPSRLTHEELTVLRETHDANLRLYRE
jgi:hypothetical protein